jgi:thymidylate kinase
LIAIEGTDGCGKSTLVSYLKEVIMCMTTREVVLYHFPSGNTHDDFHTYRQIMNMLKDPETDPNELQRLMLKNIADTMYDIEQDLRQDKVVILDRWILSNIVYSFTSKADEHIKFLRSCTQTYIKNDTEQDLRVINTFDIHKMIYKGSNIKRIYDLYPDLIFTIDPPKDIVLDNLKNRKGQDDINDTDIKRIEENYKAFNLIYMKRNNPSAFYGHTLQVPNMEILSYPSSFTPSEYWKSLYSEAIYYVGAEIKRSEML